MILSSPAMHLLSQPGTSQMTCKRDGVCFAIVGTYALIRSNPAPHWIAGRLLKFGLSGRSARGLSMPVVGKKTVVNHPVGKFVARGPIPTRLSHSASMGAGPLPHRYKTFACSAAVTSISSCRDDIHPFSRATAPQSDNGPSCRRPC